MVVDGCTIVLDWVGLSYPLNGVEKRFWENSYSGYSSSWLVYSLATTRVASYQASCIVVLPSSTALASYCMLSLTS